MTIEYTPLSKLERDDIARQALEAAAKRIEQQAAGNAYTQAFARAAKIIRAMKPA